MSEEISKELGRKKAVYLKEVGQMIELPSNIIQADHYRISTKG
jgi:hypothetical protein